MEKLEFVDTHIHLYDMQHPELVYGHWQPTEPHPVIGWQNTETRREKLRR